MNRFLCTYLLLAFLFSLFSVEARPEQMGVDLFEKGKEYVESGLYKDAACAWIEYAELKNEPDYIVGHELIKLVTKHRLTDYYEKSGELYLKGLTVSEIDDEVQELLYDELAYIESMFGQRESRRHKRLIDDRNPQILTIISDFWSERSLTPSNTYNERLMEHWERVNYAIENFNTSSRSLFDDRGKMYIRFGEPDRTRSGIFMYNPGFANYLIATRMDDGRGQGSSLENAVNTTSYLNTLYQTRQYHQYPTFEVWVYTNLVPGRDNVIYLFGNNNGGNVMTFKRSVDDFVPSAAYSSTQRNNAFNMSELGLSTGESSTGDSDDGDDRSTDILSEVGNRGVGNSERVTPALILQMMYYRQLVTLDVFFSGRYDEMMDRYMNTSLPLSSTLARQFQQVNTARVLVSQREVPDEYSSNKNQIFDVNPGVYPYRFYDDELNPELRVYFSENLDEAITFEELKKRNNLNDVRYEDYEVIRTIDLYNDTEARIERVNHKSSAHVEGDPLTSNMIKIPHHEKLSRLLLTSELYDRSIDDDNLIAENSTLRINLKGTGSSTADVEPPAGSDAFIASDVILGYSDLSSPEDIFEISHDRIIPANSSINFYYEAYNIPRSNDGLYRYTLTYTIKRDRSLFGRLIRFGRVSDTSMTIENTNDHPVFRQQLEIISDQVSEGDYILELLLVPDGNPEAAFTREIKFKVD